MIKILILFISSFVPIQDNCFKMDEVRENYGNIHTEQELNNFIELVESMNCVDSAPYLASATMQKAQFALAPWTKYRYFTEGKKMLEKFIEKYPQNLEAKYIRFLVQTHAPFFLGYRSEIKGDAAFIRANIKNIDLSSSYKKQIIDHVNDLENK
jgi:outer membrane protein assembly factor BamD (BamD/ComL family)